MHHLLLVVGRLVQPHPGLHVESHSMRDAGRLLMCRHTVASAASVSKSIMHVAVAWQPGDPGKPDLQRELPSYPGIAATGFF